MSSSVTPEIKQGASEPATLHELGTQRKPETKSASGTKFKARGTSSQNVDAHNPEDLLSKLESMDLTEEETEDLLKEALALNKKLKQHLHSQNMARQGQAGSPASSSPGLGIRTKSMYPALPPIQKSAKKNPETTKAHGSAKSRTSPEYIRSHSSAHLKTGSAQRRNSSSPKRTIPKPEWNDRFNYT